MNSLVKAGILSLVVFAVILGAFFVLRGSKDGNRLPEPTGGGAPKVTKATPTPKETKKAEPLPLVERQQTQLTVEVLEKGRKRRLTGSHVLVLATTEADRPGRIAWESERSGSGLFEVGLPAGAYQVQAQCPRYKGEKRSLTLIEGTPQTLVFELERGNSISGRVLSSAAAGIGGARVVALEELSRPDADLEELLMDFINIPTYTGKTAAETVSASDGTYQLDGLDFRYYTVRAVATGYAPNKVDQVPAPRDQVDIILPKGSTVTGVVKDAEGRAVADANVHAYSEIESQNVFEIIMWKARPPVDTAKSEANGQFQFETLGPGVYNFLIEGKGYQTGRQMKVRVAEGTSLEFVLKPGLIIKGFVRGPSDEPVSGARVRASLTGAGQGRQDHVNISFDDGSVPTDDQGFFTFDTLEEGSYTLLCSHPDYQTLQRRDLRPSNDEVSLKMSPGGRLRGLVVDGANGSPVPGARISASDVADLHKDAVSQQDGTFVLTGLNVTNRPISVTVVADGFARQRRDVKVQENTEVEEKFELAQTARVVGRVLNSNGDPLRGARVMAKRATQGSSVEQTLGNDLTDAEGKFILPGVEAGADTWVRVKKSEYLDGYSEAFSLEAGGELTIPDIVLQLGGAVGGRVTGPDGQPVSGCMVTVMREGDTDLYAAVSPTSASNANGEYVIQGLASGQVTLVVKGTHFLEKKVPGVQILEGKKNNVDVQLERGGSIAGRVIDGKSQPVSGADIQVRDFSAGVKELRSSSLGDGTFTVEGIASTDTVEITVAHEDYGSYTSDKVAVGTTGLEVVLKGLGVMKGQVVSAEGDVVENFSVQPQLSVAGVTPRKQLKAESYNAADGSFEYRGLPSGIYTVQVRAPEYAVATLTGVQVNEGDEVDLGRIVLPAGGIVFGTVVDAATRAPVAGARVQILQGSSRFVRRDAASAAGGAAASTNPIQTTDAAGSFKYVGLKGGALTLRVSHPSYVSKEVREVNPDVAEQSQGIVVDLETGGEIRGTVLDSEGKPRAGMPVYLIGDDAAKNQTAQSDRDGRFHFTGVPSGVFTVKAHKFGVAGESAAEQAEISLEMASGGVQEVELSLE